MDSTNTKALLRLPAAHLNGPALNWAALTACGWKPHALRGSPLLQRDEDFCTVGNTSGEWNAAPSLRQADWDHLQGYHVRLMHQENGWLALACKGDAPPASGHGSTPYEAGCRAIACFHFGALVPVPAHLAQLTH